MPDEVHLLREACLIDEHWIDTADAWIDVDSPADGEIIGRVPKMGAAEAQAAIDAAERACRPGRPRPPRSAPASCAPGSI